MRTYLVEMIWSFLRVLHGVDAIKTRFVQLREPRSALSVVGIEVFFDDARCSCCLWVQWPTLPPTKHISCMGPWCHQWWLTFLTQFVFWEIYSETAEAFFRMLGDPTAAEYQHATQT